MNPLVLIGIGAAVLMVIGGKKKAPETEYGADSDPDPSPTSTVQLLGKKTNATKKAVMVRSAPLNYTSTATGAVSIAAAKQCHLQGMTDIEKITECIAAKAFPGWNWVSRVGWQKDAWVRMKNVARIEMGLPPIVI